MQFINLTRSRGNVVYVIYAVKNGVKIPFYVGESGRGIARISDYINASFGAATDFKVGRTVRLLEARGYEVVAELENTPERKLRERELIEKFHDMPLLNHVQSYNYKTQDKEAYETLLERFIEERFT